MGADIMEHRLHIAACHIIPTLQIGMGLGHAVKEQGAAGADAYLHHGMLPGRHGQTGNIVQNTVLCCDGPHLRLHP